MANHLLVEKCIKEKDAISDRELFTSREFCEHLAELADSMTKRYLYKTHLRVKSVWEFENPETAWTNKNVIWINAGHESMMYCTSRERRYAFCMGLLLHEMGHILHTNFNLYVFAQKSLREKRKLLPLRILSPDEMVEVSEVNSYLRDIEDQRIVNAILRLLQRLMNIIEDANVERQVMRTFPGYAKYVAWRREEKFADCQSLPDLYLGHDESWNDSFQIFDIMGLLFSYAIFGKVKGDTAELLGYEEGKFLHHLREEIDSAVKCNDSSQRIKETVVLFMKLFPYWSKYAEYLKQTKEDAEQTPERDSRNSLQSAEEEDGCSFGEDERLQRAMPISTPMPTDCIGLCASSSFTADGTSDEETESDTSDEEVGAHSGYSSSLPEEGKEADVSGAAPSETEKNDSSESNLPESAGEESLTEKNREDDNAQAQIQKLLSNIVQSNADKSLEQERLNGLNQLANSMDVNSIHHGVKCSVRRDIEVTESMKERYELISPPLEEIARRMQRKTLRDLPKKGRGGKMTNLYMGKRLEPRSLARNDGRVFSKHSLPTKKPRIAVTLLLDESGSMSGYKIAKVRDAAIILYHFCERLHIPVSVLGHKTGNKDAVILNSYAEFHKIDHNDKYRLLNVEAYGANRDGFALKYAAECLTKITADVKLLVIISDGRPNAAGYFGKSAYEDIRNVKKAYDLKGIKTIAAAIDEDKDIIKEIYEDGFLDITNLDELPEKLASLVKKYVV